MMMEIQRKVTLIGHLILLISALICIILNFRMIHIAHSALNGLPVIIYVTYFTRDSIIFYIIIIFSTIVVFLVWLNKRGFLLRILNLSQIFLYLIFLYLLYWTPHLTIVIPVSSAPAILEHIYEGGWIFIGLLILQISIAIFYIVMDKISKKYLIGLFFIFCGAFVAEFVHESGHAFFTYLSGGTVLEFIPFPIFRDGQWIAGLVVYAGVPAHLEPLVLLGSEILQWVLLAGISVILVLYPNLKYRSFFIGIFIFAWLDFPLYTINNALGIPHWFFFGGVEGDVVRFCALTGFPLEVMIVFALVQIALGVVFLYKIVIRRSLGKNI